MTKTTTDNPFISIIEGIIERWNSKDDFARTVKGKETKRIIEKLLEAEVNKEHKKVQFHLHDEQQLDAFRTLFDWETEYSITSWWKAEINHDIEDTIACESAEDALAYLNYDKESAEPDTDNWDCSRHIEFPDGEPYIRELSVSVEDLRPKLNK